MYEETYLDTLVVSISSDCGSNWTVLYSKSAHDLETVGGFVSSPYVPAANEWVTSYIDLSAYMGQLIKVRFEAHTGYGNDLYVDDINLFHGTVSIPEDSLAAIRIFPNPSTGIISISDPSNVIQNVQVYDSQGRLVYDNSTKQAHQPIDISNFEQSFYFVKIRTDRGLVTKKVCLVK